MSDDFIAKAFRAVLARFVCAAYNRHVTYIARCSVTAKSVEETHAVAAKLAALLQPGDVVTLSGDLGAGKTTFTRGLVAALGLPAQTVTSPTFTLLHEYRGGPFAVYHADAYRLTRAADLDDIGLGDAIHAGDGITLIEWAERVAEALPDERLEIRLEDSGVEERQITFVGRGERWSNLVTRLGAPC